MITRICIYIEGMKKNFTFLISKVETNAAQHGGSDVFGGSKRFNS